MNIRDLIGEATEYDKKLELEIKKPKSWCKSVSAFANTLGGKLIFGIADEGQMIGLANEQGYLTNAGALIADENPIRCSRLFCTR